MQFTRLFGVFFVLAALTVAQSIYDKADIDTSTPEGQLLTEAAQQEDAAQRAALYQKFVAQYPDHKFAALAYNQLLNYYVEKQDQDKVLETGGKLLALNPARADIANQCLKAAEAKKDPKLIAEWSVKAHDAAQKMAAAPKPEDEGAVEQWQKSVDYAKQVGKYAEYSLFAAALQSTDAKQKLALIGTFEEHYPNSQYSSQLSQQKFDTYRVLGDQAGMVKAAEETLAKNPNSEDALLVLADEAYRKKDTARVLELSEKLVQVMETKPKPEGVDDAAWEGKKNSIAGVAHYMRGITLMGKGQLTDAEKDLESALPGAEGNNNMKAEILFNLGLINYKLGEKGPNTKRILAAVKYNEQCAAISSPFQAQARKNLAAIRANYRIR